MDQKEKLELVLPFVQYCPDTGELFVLKDSKRLRRLLPTEEGMLQSCINGHKVKIKFNKFVFFVHTGVLPPEGTCIFHKDMQEDNFKFNNLVLITKEQNFRIIESLKNLKGALKIYPHKNDAFSYVVEYKDKGRLKKEVISDVQVARERFSRLQLKFTKFVSKFVITS